jgi:hypothetical protein
VTAAARLRQAVLVARDLDATTARLREALGLGEPFADPEVGWFGLRNAVFAIGDTFLEVVSPVREDAAAARHLARRGGDGGYMLMFQVPDVAAARARAAEHHVREVFDVTFEDVAEAHLHPADMRGAIVAVTEPRPPESWRWGGPGWRERSVPGGLAGATVALADPDAARARWGAVLGGDPPVAFTADDAEPGLVEVLLDAPALREPIEVAGVRFAPPR